ncbi:MAG: hypothetical protein H8D46_03100 [FCB group bacterium]|nr:hypothetical protein [FCB group bacterium]
MKLLIATALGGILVYRPGKIKDETKILYSALISLIAVALVGTAKAYQDSGSGFEISASIITVVIAVILLTKDMDFDSRLMYVFAVIIGVICGMGHVFFGIIFTIIVYLILHQGHHFLGSIHKDGKPESGNETKKT